MAKPIVTTTSSALDHLGVAAGKIRRDVVHCLSSRLDVDLPRVLCRRRVGEELDD